MNKPVDYDDLFPKPPAHHNLPKSEIDKEKEWQERWKKDMAERNAHSERVEKFRNGPKHHEGYMERSEGFADIQYPGGPPIYSRWARNRYQDLKFIDFVFEYIDAFAGAVLVGVVVWMLFPYLIPVALAADVGFNLGITLKLRVRDRMPSWQAFKCGLPMGIVSTVLTLIIIIAFTFGG